MPIMFLPSNVENWYSEKSLLYHMPQLLSHKQKLDPFLMPELYYADMMKSAPLQAVDGLTVDLGRIQISNKPACG
jgi:hypothetical protein